MKVANPDRVGEEVERHVSKIRNDLERAEIDLGEQENEHWYEYAQEREKQ